jgi:acyl-coenzyme A synthetase/AMP-(fatty) acid ligase
MIVGQSGCIPLDKMRTGSVLSGRGEELRGQSVLLVIADPLLAAAALIELDGIAARVILYPPDFPQQYMPYIQEIAEVTAIVSDGMHPQIQSDGGVKFVACNRELTSAVYDRSAQCETEWVLLTSGTTGQPKLVAHTLASLAGAIDSQSAMADQIVWSTFYDIRRYGGLQIFLRAVLTGKPLILSGTHEPIAEFVARAGAYGVTHISGTASHWRRALMSPAARGLEPRYVRLSGEIADQAILNQVQSLYPQARVAHAFATTEAGVAFAVNDGHAGFPTSVLETTPDVEMKVVERSLRVRSARTASRYLGSAAPALKDADGFVDTGDVVEIRNGRYYFVGRRDGIISVGGQKVHPEEIEAVINLHPVVQMSLVRRKKNPITGALVVADVVLKDALHCCGEETGELQQEILSFCRESLSPYKVPAIVNFVQTLSMNESGKLVRRDA